MKSYWMLAGLTCLSMPALGQSYLTSDINAVDAAQQKHQTYWESLKAAKQQEGAKQHAEKKVPSRSKRNRTGLQNSAPVRVDEQRKLRQNGGGAFTREPYARRVTFPHQTAPAHIPNMLTIIALCAFAIVLGACVQGRRVAARLRVKLDEQSNQNEALKRVVARLRIKLDDQRDRIEGLKREALEREAHAKRKREKFAENDVANSDNQLRFIQQACLRAHKPVNREAVEILYVLEDWLLANVIKKWRISFEVGMGAFIKTVEHDNPLSGKRAFSSYNSKRVDFLIIDNFGSPKLAIEYHGSGHDGSDPDDAAARMDVKTLALEKAGIPLLVLPKNPTKSLIISGLSKWIPVHAKSDELC